RFWSNCRSYSCSCSSSSAQSSSQARLRPFHSSTRLATRNVLRKIYALTHLLGWWNGRHVRLRGVCRKACGFKSRPEHQIIEPIKDFTAQSLGSSRSRKTTYRTRLQLLENRRIHAPADLRFAFDATPKRERSASK